MCSAAVRLLQLYAGCSNHSKMPQLQLLLQARQLCLQNTQQLLRVLVLQQLWAAPAQLR